MPRKRIRFQVSDRWPDRDAPEEVKADAIEALVASHTLIVGQSRSGKTTAARRLIEEILLNTGARIVLLDPNADFRWLAKTDDTGFKSLWSAIAPAVKTATPRGQEPWGIPWSGLSIDEMAAFLKLTPTESFAEYQHLVRHFAFEQQDKRKIGALDDFQSSRYFQIAPSDEQLDRYRLRLRHLSQLQVWAEAGRMDLDSLLAGSYRAAVVDLSHDNPEVRAITAARALQVLWREGAKVRTQHLKRSRRSRVSGAGTLVVIDEAHLLAPALPSDPQQSLVSERVERFADQGKKLNLYLMLITQQPSKLNPKILAECNNRIILRMNERLSLKALEDTYGGIKGRYDGALTFSPGEALIEGALLCDESPPSSSPRGIRFEQGRTREGGGTPSTAWAKPKPT